MIVKPWHSAKRLVHHMCTNCKSGNNIEKENREEGDGDKVLCEECHRLLESGNC